MARMFYISLGRQIWKIRQTDRKYIQTDKYVDIQTDKYVDNQTDEQIY